MADVGAHQGWGPTDTRLPSGQSAIRRLSLPAGYHPDRLCALTAGSYIDHKCPFTGNVSIRGRILSGTVKSTKMNRTLIVRRNYLHFIKKYQRCAL
jgi:Ribosomal_S17 N-terminal